MIKKKIRKKGETEGERVYCMADLEQKVPILIQEFLHLEVKRVLAPKCNVTILFPCTPLYPDTLFRIHRERSVRTPTGTLIIKISTETHARRCSVKTKIQNTCSTGCE